VCRLGFTSVITGGILLNTHTSHSPRMHYKCSTFGSDRSLFRGTLLLEQCAFSGVFLEGLSWKYIPRTLHACAKDVAGCDPSMKTLYLENDMPFQQITLSTGGIFPKIHTADFLGMRYKWGKFGCSRSIFKGTSLREQSTFLALFRLPLEEPSWKFTPHTLHACVTRVAGLVASGQ